MPFLARWKGTIPAGVSDETSVMCAIDLSPTFCRLAGVPIPESERLDGLDRSDVLLGKASARAKPIFWQYGAPHAVLKPGKLEFQSPSFAIREGDWKLLVNPDGSEARLFHLPNDPGEATNLLVREPERAASLQRQLAAWATDVGYQFEGQAPLQTPAPTVAALVNNQLLRFLNHGVKVRENGAWNFNGKSWLDLPQYQAPKVAGKWIRIKAAIAEASPQGVILAHGGDKSGYSLYLDQGKLSFATCVNWKRTVIASSDPLPNRPCEVEAYWSAEGAMQLKIGKQLVAKGQSPGHLKVQPGDSLQIGGDLVKPVGAYDVPNAFTGTITDLSIQHAR